MSTSVLAIASSHTETNHIVDHLHAAVFPSDAISVLFPDKGTSRDFAHEKQTKMPEGATIGAGSGGVVGAAVGLLAGIGALAIPGLGPFIAAGPIMAALSGGAIGAGVGGIAGALIGLGIPEYEAKRYEGKVAAGGILISVHCNNSEQISTVKKIFTDAGASDISSTGETAADHARGVEKAPVRPIAPSETPVVTHTTH